MKSLAAGESDVLLSIVFRVVKGGSSDLRKVGGTSMYRSM